MVKVTINNQTFFVDGILKDNLDMAKKSIKQDWDMVFVIDGMEGSGKSVLAQQLAFYCDPTLTLDRITFTHEDFKKAILKAGQYQSVVFDEAFQGLNTRGAMSKINKALCSMLAEIRQKNLFVFVCIPSFFDLDRYVSLWRSRGLFHCYTHKWKRGRFAFFSQKNKIKLWANGKKYYSYNKPKANFYAQFTKYYTVDENEYKKKKLESLSRHVEGEGNEDKENKWKTMTIVMLVFLYKAKVLKVTKIADILGITERYVYYLLNTPRNEGNYEKDY